MSRHGALVQYQEPSSGTNHKHNFVNRYLADDELRKPSADVAHAIANATQKDLNRMVGAKIAPGHASNFQGNSGSREGQFIKYTPKQQGDGHNSSASQRIIKMHEVQVDPLEPAKFKHKRVPGGPGSPPKTIMHSPPRKLTVKDQQDWKIPPCISNWKNAKGYTIPLEMRLSADGRTLQQHTINEKHAKLANSFYIAEKQARKEIEERNKIQKTITYKEFLKQEEKMRDAAAQARAEKNKIIQAEEVEEEGDKGRKHRAPLTEEEEEAKKERDTFRYINKREQERDRRLDAARNKKSKSARDADRDISEKIALGQAQPTVSKESMYDQRLFNQTSGLESGFGDEDEYNVFDKPLFQDKTAASIYNVKEYNDNDDEDAGAGGEKNNVEKMLNRAPNRGFEGAAADKKSSRTKPVEFEKHSDDTFDLGSFITDNKKK